MKLAIEKDIYIQLTDGADQRVLIFASEITAITEYNHDEDPGSTLIYLSGCYRPIVVTEKFDEVCQMIGIKPEQPKEQQKEPPDNLISLFSDMDKRQLSAMSIMIKNALTKSRLNDDPE